MNQLKNFDITDSRKHLTIEGEIIMMLTCESYRAIKYVLSGILLKSLDLKGLLDYYKHFNNRENIVHKLSIALNNNITLEDFMNNEILDKNMWAYL